MTEREIHTEHLEPYDVLSAAERGPVKKLKRLRFM